MTFYKHEEATLHGVVSVSVSEKLLKIREYPVWKKRMIDKFPTKDHSFEHFLKEYIAVNNAIIDDGKVNEDPVCGC